MSPGEFEAFQLANLKNDYDATIAEIRRREPPDHTYTSTQVAIIIELLSGLLERFKMYELPVQYLVSSSLPTLGSWLAQFRTDVEQAHAVFRQKLEAHLAANRQEILEAQRNAAREAHAIFIRVIGNNAVVRDTLFDQWRNANFPTPVPLPVCPYCKQPFGITHSRAVCPLTNKIIFTQLWSG